MLRKLQIHKGWVAALLALIPYVVATVKFTFYYSGCMDGFAIHLITTAMILFIGGPLSLLACLAVVFEVKTLLPSLSRVEGRIYWIGHVLAALSVVVAVKLAVYF